MTRPIGVAMYGTSPLVGSDTEGSLWYRAETAVPVGTEPIVSTVGELPVTRFPIGPPNPDLDDVVYHPESGAPIIAGQVSVQFAPGTSPADIETAAVDVGGSVSGYLPALGMHVLSLPPLSSGDDLPARLVHNHRPYWSMFCGACSIADDHSHGTVVTGIIASDNNSVGFAGLLPETNMLVVKAFDEEGRSTTEHMAHGLTTVSRRGVSVINASFGLYRAETSPLLMTIVDYEVAADGALLVAAAGNDNTHRPLFPAASEHALAVGGVGVNSERRWNHRPRIGSNSTEEAPFVSDRLDWPGADFFTAVLDINERREVIVLRHMWEMEFALALNTLDDLTLSEGIPVRHTGWTAAHEVINLDPTDTGPVTIRFALSDGGGRDLDSVLLIDDVRIE